MSLLELLSKPKEKTIEDVPARIEDLTCEELLASEKVIPEECVYTVWVSFISAHGRKYSATHVCNHPPTGPYILLASEDKDKEDFKRVEKIVAEEARASALGKISERGDMDICNVLEINRKLTRKDFVDCVGRYEQHFKDVAIPVAYFYLPKEFKSFMQRLKIDP